MSLREESLNVFFKTKFQKSGIVVDEVVAYINEIRVYVSTIGVTPTQINALKVILGWELDDISAESGTLVFSYV